MCVLEALQRPGESVCRGQCPCRGGGLWEYSGMEPAAGRGVWCPHPAPSPPPANLGRAHVIISRLKAANLVCARGRVGSMRWGEAHTRGLAWLSVHLRAGCAPQRRLRGDLGEVETWELAASDPRGFAQQEREAARAPCWVFAAQQAAVTGVSCGSAGLEALTAGPRACRRSPPRFPGTSLPGGNHSEPCGLLQPSPTGV